MTLPTPTALHVWRLIDGAVLSLMQPLSVGGLQTCLTAIEHGLRLDLSDTPSGLMVAVSDPDLRFVIGLPAQLATLIWGMDAAGPDALPTDAA